MRSRVGMLLLPLILSFGLLQQVAAVEASPKDCYLSYLGALYYAKDLKTIAQYFPKAQRDVFKSMNAQQQQQRLKECKEHYLAKPVIQTQKIDGAKAHLTASGIGTAGDKTFNASVTVDLVHEDGYWRIAGSTINGNVEL